MPLTVDMTTGLTDSCKRVDNVKRAGLAKVIHIVCGRYIKQQILVRQSVATGFAGGLGVAVNKLCNCEESGRYARSAGVSTSRRMPASLLSIR
ncbi:hypothetical protein P5929_30885, partial [Bacillus cereus]|nr:hypothetical protein [Bacillus cereus]